MELACSCTGKKCFKSYISIEVQRRMAQVKVQWAVITIIFSYLPTSNLPNLCIKYCKRSIHTNQLRAIRPYQYPMSNILVIIRISEMLQTIGIIHITVFQIISMNMKHSKTCNNASKEMMRKRILTIRFPITTCWCNRNTLRELVFLWVQSLIFNSFLCLSTKQLASSVLGSRRLSWIPKDHLSLLPRALLISRLS